MSKETSQKLILNSSEIFGARFKSISIYILILFLTKIVAHEHSLSNTIIQHADTCRSKAAHANIGNCIPVSNCQKMRGDYHLLGSGSIDVCGINSANDPLVCCVNQRPFQLQDRLSLRKCMEYNRDIKGDGPMCKLGNPLIIGGEESHVGDNPHFALIGWKQSGSDQIEFNCGATLISHRFVLTAAHCLLYQGQRPSIVRLGEYDLNRDDDSTHLDFGIESITRPKDYKFYNDIALIKLDQKVPFTANIRPACLWNKEELDATKAVAVGFGYTQFLGESSKVMREVTLDIIDQKTCNGLVMRSRRLKYGVKDTQICAAVLSGGKDTCAGDSGGPLQVRFNSDPCMTYVVGITSLGKMCGVKNTPGVYTKVSKYLDWIENIVWNGEDEV